MKTNGIFEINKKKETLIMDTNGHTKLKEKVTGAKNKSKRNKKKKKIEEK